MPSENLSTWPNIPFSEVRAYFYNEKGDMGVPIITAGRLHPTVANPDGASLSAPQVEEFKYAFLTQHPPTAVAACYNPRHAFVFRDSEKRVIATVGICFECHTYRAMPNLSALRPDWSALAELVRKLGLPLGRN